MQEWQGLCLVCFKSLYKKTKDMYVIPVQGLEDCDKCKRRQAIVEYYPNLVIEIKKREKHKNANN